MTSIQGGKAWLNIWSSILIRPNEKISVFQVMGLKILGRVGTPFFNLFSFFRKKYIILLNKAKCLSKCIKLYFFLENLKQILGFTNKFR